MEAEYRHNQVTVLSHLVDTVEKEIQALNDFSARIASQEEVMGLFQASGRDDYSQSFQAAQTLSRLDSVMQLASPQTGFVQNLYLLSPDNHLVWTGNGLYEQDDPLLPDRQLLAELLKDIKGKRVQFFEDPQVCCILFPLPSAYLPVGYLAVSVHNEAIENMIAAVGNVNASRLYITLSDGTVCFRSEMAQTDALEEELLREQGNDEILGNRAVLYRTASTALPVSYAVIVPLQSDDAGLGYLRMTTLISFSVSLLGGLALVFLMARRNYMPVRELVDAARQTIDVPEGEDNEYQLVSGALRLLYEQHDSNQKLITRQNRTLTSYYLAGILKRRIHVQTMDGTARDAISKELGLSNYVILLILFDADAAHAQHSDLNETAYAGVYEVRLEETICERLRPQIRATRATVYDYDAFVLSLEESAMANYQSDIREAVETLCAQFEEQFGCSIYAACSGLHSGMESLPDAYEEVEELMPYAVLSRGEMVYPEDVLSPDVGSLPMDAADGQILTNLVASGDAAALEKQIVSMIDRYSSEGLSFHTIKGLSAGMVCRMMEKTGKLPEKDREKLLHQLSILMRESTLERVRGVVVETGGMICEMTTKPEGTSRKDALIERIEQELSISLYDENLNITFLANRLDMNAKYLSSVYQETTGDNLMDVIHRRRVARFKELMADPKVSVRGAAQQVGYSSVVTLNRWFKKFEGMTPGRWRET